VYEARGELQFIVEAMQRAGAGVLYEQSLRTRAWLDAQGLFDASRERQLPAYPRAVGIVTSLGAAGLHDVVTALARRSPHVHVIIYPSLVRTGRGGARRAVRSHQAGLSTCGGRRADRLPRWWITRRPLGLQRRARGAGRGCELHAGGVRCRP
jgi:hypothetical protein